MGWRSWLVACVSDGDIGDVLMAGIAFHFDVRTVRTYSGRAVEMFLFPLWEY